MGRAALKRAGQDQISLFPKAYEDPLEGEEAMSLGRCQPRRCSLLLGGPYVLPAASHPSRLTETQACPPALGRGPGSGTKPEEPASCTVLLVLHLCFQALPPLGGREWRGPQ